MPERDKIELVFQEDRKTKRTVKFDEVLGDEAWSDQGVAIGPLYLKKLALELIGNPTKIKVVVTPLN